MKKKPASIKLFVYSITYVFLAAQLGCSPPTITIEAPTVGFTDQEHTDVDLSFVAGGSPIDLSSFTALNNNIDIVSDLDVAASGADGLIQLIDGINLLMFSLKGEDGIEGVAHTMLYKPFPEDPSLSGSIDLLTPVSFNAEIQESRYAPVALEDYAATYGISPTTFSEGIRAEISYDEHSVQLYLANMTRPYSNSGQGTVAANPNEQITFAQMILPLSITQGAIVRDYTLLSIFNEIDRYMIFDNGEGTALRIDWIDPYDPSTWTEQWLYLGEPIDPEKGVGLSCGAALLGTVAATISLAVAGPAVTAGVLLWNVGLKGFALFGLLVSCSADLGNYWRLN